jgi:hypothetical protein
VHGEEEEEGGDKAERQGRTAAESSPAVSGGRRKIRVRTMTTRRR